MARVETPLGIRGLSSLSLFAREGGTVVLVGDPYAKGEKSSFITARQGGALRRAVAATSVRPIGLSYGQAEGLHTLFGGTEV